MSDTPRTDAAERQIVYMEAAYYAQPVTDLARTLERELAAATKERDEARAALRESLKYIYPFDVTPDKKQMWRKAAGLEDAQ